MDIKKAQNTTKRLGTLWIVSFAVINVILEVYTVVSSSRASMFNSADSLASAVLTIPNILSWFITLVYLFPLLFFVHRYSKQAEMRKTSLVTLLGIVFISVWLVGLTTLIIVSFIHL